MNIAEVSISGMTLYGYLCLLITLNVRNAFKIAPFRAINVILGRLKISKYLIQIIRSYFEERVVLVPGDSRPYELPVTVEVLLGTVLGLTFCITFSMAASRGWI